MDNLPPPPPPPNSSGGDFFVFDKPPKVRNHVNPEYPALARSGEIEGIVVVKCTVDEKGKVIRVSILQTASPIFNEAALAAVRKWTFEPAEQSGNPVPATITIPLEFTLNR